MKFNKRSVLNVVLILILSFTFLSQQGSKEKHPSPVLTNANNGFTQVGVIENAFNNQLSNIQVTQQGVVIRLLPDDLRGSRHQKFIVRLDTGLKLLIVHNIDLAPKVSTLSKGSMITFRGEYEWNHKGGLIHWTHHDPQGRHEDGWLEYKGKRYQ